MLKVISAFFLILFTCGFWGASIFPHNIIEDDNQGVIGDLTGKFTIANESNQNVQFWITIESGTIPNQFNLNVGESKTYQLTPRNIERAKLNITINGYEKTFTITAGKRYVLKNKIDKSISLFLRE